MNDIDQLIKRYPQLDVVEKQIENAYYILRDSFKNGGKLMIAGNGGSCADCEHIAGELMKGFLKKRPISEKFKDKLISIDKKAGEMLANELQGALPVISLTGSPALNTAVLNDTDGLMCFAQQVMGFGNREDTFWGISTSGMSKNVYYAAITAKAKDIKVIALTGEKRRRTQRYRRCFHNCSRRGNL